MLLQQFVTRELRLADWANNSSFHLRCSLTFLRSFFHGRIVLCGSFFLTLLLLEPASHLARGSEDGLDFARSLPRAAESAMTSVCARDLGVVQTKLENPKVVHAYNETEKSFLS